MQPKNLSNISLKNSIKDLILFLLEHMLLFVAGLSSPVAHQAHNLKVVGSNPTPATHK